MEIQRVKNGRSESGIGQLRLLSDATKFLLPPEAGLNAVLIFLQAEAAGRAYHFLKMTYTAATSSPKPATWFQPSLSVLNTNTAQMVNTVSVMTS